MKEKRNPYAMSQMANVNLRISSYLMSYQWAIRAASRAASYGIPEGLVTIKHYANYDNSELSFRDTPLHSILDRYIKIKFPNLIFA